MSSRHRDRDRDPGYKDRDRHYSEKDRERDWGRDHGRHDSRYDGRGSDRLDHRHDSRYDSRHDSRHDSKRQEHRELERPRDKDRHRSSHSRERSDRDKDKHKSRDRPREGSPADDSSRKRRRTDAEKQQQQQQQQAAPQQQPAKQQQPQLTAEEKEAALKKQREDEQNALDAEMEERRKRVEEWRKKRAAEAAEAERKQQEEAAAAAAAAAAQNNKGWSLEDDEDDEHEHQQEGDEDEVDPLDAFMASNAATAAAPAAEADNIEQPEQQQQQQLQQPQQADADMADADDTAQPPAAVAAAAEQPEDDEIDPLDAFMAAEVMPEVAKVRWSAPVKTETAAQEASAVDEVAAGAVAAANSSRPGSKGGPSSGKRGASSQARAKARRYYGSSESSEEFTDSEEEPSEEEEQDDATWAKNVTAGKLSKGEKLMAVDHSTIDYPSFRRNFYIEVPDIKRMEEAEVAALRKELDGIKVRGKNPPKPIRTWTQAGISSKVLDVLRKGGCEQPLPIQAQALPIIMSGRDCIGIAKTGSGKTLAFVIPMLRHIKDQPALANGDGPVALIMAPTRELVQQIAKEVKKLGRAVGLTAVAVFGGSGVANQISELKRGTEVVAATPGRLIDLLVSGGGKITNLRRVTYLVLDEADRMFDMGFEPQIMRIVANIRPDRQTVMFSATFPRAVETLARQVLHDPVEIQVGGRSVVNSDIAQYVEIRPESDRFLRLLEILGEWYEKGKIIIFVHTQDKCDNLFRDLLKSGYPCLSLHGGKEQSDRECTISDFKGAVCNILVATSIAARGLDVRELVLVVNYDVPNHHEDYVHRVGRTGRAGNKGTAITFIGPDEDRYAPDLVKALKESKAVVPQDLQALADAFGAKRKAGLVQGHGSGYGGSGFKFDKEEDNKVKAARKSKAKEFGLVVDEDEEEKEAKSEEEDDIRPTMLQPTTAAGITLPTVAAAASNGLPVVSLPATAPAVQDPATAAMLAAVAASGSGAAPVVQPAAAAVPKFMPAQPGQQFPGQAVPQTAQSLVEAARLAAGRAAAAVTGQAAPAAAGGAAAAPASATLAAAQAAAMRAAALAAAFAQGGGAAVAAPAQQQQQRQPGFESELPINDFPQNARWKVTHKGFQAEITELTGAAVTTKGLYIAKGEPPEGERKLYLLIEAPTEAQVRRAKQEIRKVIEEHVEKAMRKDMGAAAGRYNIM